MIDRRRVLLTAGGALLWGIARFASASQATRPSADLEADLKRLRDHDPKDRASPAVIESARRVFAEMSFVGLDPERVRERLGPPHEEERIANRPVWRYSYHDGEQGVVRNLWFDFHGRAVWGVEPIATQ